MNAHIDISKRPSLSRNAAWMFAANVAYAGCQWGLLSLLARFSGAEVVGKYVLATAIISPVMAFCMLSLRSALATDARREFPFRVYLSLRIAATAAAMCVIAVVGVAAGYGWSLTSVIWAVTAVASMEAVSDVFYGALQRRERLVWIAQSQIIKSILGLACFAATLAATSACWALLSVAAVRLAVLLCWDIPQTAKVFRQTGFAKNRAAANSRHRSSPRAVASLALQTLPLGVVMMLIALGSAVPRYYVEHHLGDRELGIFGAIAYFSFVGITAVGAVGQSAQPRLARAAAEGRRGEFFGLLGRLAIFGLAVGVSGLLVALVAGRGVLQLTYGSEYAAHQTVLVWVMVATVASCPASFAGFSLTAARCFRIQVPLYACVVAVTAAASAWLVPRFGMSGAALAMLAAAVVQILGALLVLTHAVPRRAALLTETPN